MDSACVYEEKTVIHELTQGLQMAEQLRVHLHSPQARDFFIQKILSSYENALFALQSGNSTGQLPSLPQSSRSPGSEEFGFHQPFSSQQGENVISKKRKGSTILEDQVRICSDNGLEVNADDGYNWRKYGQKDIQGAKFPRSYYKCSYRKVQKCFATKQVQRKDKDPTVFETAYKGKHTCNCNHSASPSPPPSPEKYEIVPTHHLQPQPSPPSPGEMLSNLRANLSVNTSELGGASDAVPSSISFPSTSSGVMEDHHQLQFPDYNDDELLQVFSPPFISPVSFESNIFAEWESWQSLDFLPDVDTDFEFNSLF